MENKIIESETIENVSNTKGGLVAKIAVAAIGLAAGVGAVLFFRKRKQNQELVDAEIVETEDVSEDEE